MGLFDWLPGSEAKEVPPGHATASHILFLSSSGDDDEAKADALLKRIEAGDVSFGDAARSFSSCPTRDVNGFIGTFSSLGSLGSLGSSLGELPYEGQDTSAFDEVVLSPETPLNTPCKVKSRWGTHIVQVEARGPPAESGGGGGDDGKPEAPNFTPPVVGGGEGRAW